PIPGRDGASQSEAGVPAAPIGVLFPKLVLGCKQFLFRQRRFSTPWKSRLKGDGRAPARLRLDREQRIQQSLLYCALWQGDSGIGGHTAGGNGGALFASGGGVSLPNTRLTANDALNGGGIEAQAVTLSLSFDELDNNQALGNANGSLVTGGAIDVIGNVVSVT